jgi:hypothetical protein
LIRYIAGILRVEWLVSGFGCFVGSPSQRSAGSGLTRVNPLTDLHSVPIQFGVADRPGVVLVVMGRRTQRRNLFFKLIFNLQSKDLKRN